MTLYEALGESFDDELVNNVVGSFNSKTALLSVSHGSETIILKIPKGAKVAIDQNASHLLVYDSFFPKGSSGKTLIVISNLKKITN